MPKINPVPTHLQKYIDYIRNTGQEPLSEAAFDDDWEPVGPRVRDELHSLGLIYSGGGPRSFIQDKEGIYLRPDLLGRG